MNLDYHFRPQPASVKSVEWANRKLSSLAERITEKYPDFFVYENKIPNKFPYAGQLCSKSGQQSTMMTMQSIMMTWTSTGLCIWPAACYIPKAKIMNFNNYNLQQNESDSSIITDDGEIFFIIPENCADWKKLEGMSHTERILFIEHRLPEFIDKIIKDKCFIDKWLKEKEIKEAAAQYA